MNIYNFMNQKYREWKRNGKSSIRFFQFKYVTTNPLKMNNYALLNTKKSTLNTR